MKKLAFLPISLLALMTAGALAAAPTSPPAGHPPMEQSVSPAGQPAEGKPAGKTGSHPMGPSAAKAPQNAEPISGQVLEAIGGGGYTYIYLQKKNGDKVWVAVLETPVKVGSLMSFRPGTVMNDFESKGLNRTFATIIFSDGPIPEPAAEMTANVKKNQLPSPGSQGAGAPKEKISVAKATGPNAITVEEAFSKSAKLDKKKVVVRGKVVKISTGIMKRNWIHIQDGTGSQAKGTHNLVCTSQDKAEVGDVVTVSGALAKDRDFGSGYRYNAIIENAKIMK